MRRSGARIYVYPAADLRFKASVEASLAGRADGRIDDDGILAAAQALLRTSYPLATVQPRGDRPLAVRGSEWDAFRDETALDSDLVNRARVGNEPAVSQLFDRYHRLAYSVAFHFAGTSPAAQDAVVAGFVALIAAEDDGFPVRIRLAIATRHAALRAGSYAGGAGRRITLQRAVLELAHAHRLVASEIAAVLGLNVREVAALATEGLRAIAARSPR